MSDVVYPYDWPSHWRSRWPDTLHVMSFEGNFISGMRLYDHVIARHAYGKYATSPADIEPILRWLVSHAYLAPCKFAPTHSRRAFLGLQYRSDYAPLRDRHTVSPVDWNYEVIANIDFYHRRIVHTITPHTLIHTLGA